MKVVITAYSAISAKHNSEALAPSLSVGDFSPFSLQNYDFNAVLPHNKNKRYLTRAALFAATATHLCIEAAQNGQATLPPDFISEAGLFLGAAPFLEAEENELEKRKPLWLLKHLPNTVASYITQAEGLHGESATLTTACASSLQAIGTAFRLIQSEQITHAFAGGGDSRLNPIALNGYQRLGALYEPPRTEDYAPLLTPSHGFIPGEGGAAFLLESETSALTRGAKPIAEILSFAASSDATSMTAPNPTGATQKLAVQKALQLAKLSPNQIGRISCHGTGTPLNDAMEALLLQEVFGFTPEIIHSELTKTEVDEAKIVTHKKEIGHLSAACGAVEMALELDRLKRQSKENEAILLQNFGFGGQNAVLILKPYR